jgi:hypothetical protein
MKVAGFLPYFIIAPYLGALAVEFLNSSPLGREKTVRHHAEATFIVFDKNNHGGLFSPELHSIFTAARQMKKMLLNLNPDISPVKTLWNFQTGGENSSINRSIYKPGSHFHGAGRKPRSEKIPRLCRVRQKHRT